ncbi:MAG: HNH endonuclease [Oscillatoriales cyanobacterium SM2_1_8]|nr:HNH endonuclease [Oscillatoriales cyanobacterium SM2_1_8]
MIRVEKGAAPPILQENAEGWHAELLALRQQKAPKKQTGKVQQRYRHKQVKAALVKAFHGRCAYCESQITAVTYGAIEHFFPKSRYPDRTFAWENLLLACDVCNSRKGDTFPLQADGAPLLVNPSAEDPADRLQFDWNPITGLASIYGRDRRGEAVVTLFDLNGTAGRTDLMARRSGYVKKLAALQKLAASNLPAQAEAQALLREAGDRTRSENEYQAFASCFADS